MNRVFQTNVNQPTQELMTDALKAMMEHPANNALIDNYREAKRQMAEAEARQTVEELVTEFLSSEGYKKWLAKELKADERRRKKHIPGDDLQRVKLYIAQLKSSLPAVIPTVTHFDESKDRWGPPRVTVTRKPSRFCGAKRQTFGTDWLLPFTAFAFFPVASVRQAPPASPSTTKSSAGHLFTHERCPE